MTHITFYPQSTFFILPSNNLKVSSFYIKRSVLLLWRINLHPRGQTVNQVIVCPSKISKHLVSLSFLHFLQQYFSYKSQLSTDRNHSISCTIYKYYLIHLFIVEIGHDLKYIDLPDIRYFDYYLQKLDTLNIWFM